LFAGGFRWNYWWIFNLHEQEHGRFIPALSQFSSRQLPIDSPARKFFESFLHPALVRQRIHGNKP
jgi:hypothetical protein